MKNAYDSNLIEIINERFKENSFGYRYENSQILRITDTVSFENIIKPVINLLNNKIFSNANEEYRKAHSFYKTGITNRA